MGLIQSCIHRLFHDGSSLRGFTYFIASEGEYLQLRLLYVAHLPNLVAGKVKKLHQCSGIVRLTALPRPKRRE